MERFFALNNDRLLVKGAKRGAIYDFKSGNIFSVDHNSKMIIELLELNKSAEISSAEIGVPLVEIINYLIGLEKLNLGLFVNKNHERSKIELNQVDRGLKFFHIELTEKCNLKCKHCYIEGQSEKNKKDTLNFTDYLKIIKEARDLGSNQLQFIGGEPFLRRDLILKLVPEAKKIGYEFIEIFSNGTLITDRDLEMAKANSLCLAISLHGSRPEIHDQITLKQGSWGKTISVIERAQVLGIPIRIAMIIMKQNECDRNQMFEFALNQLGVKNIKIDYVRPSGKGCGSDLSSESICERQKLYKPQFSNISSHIFSMMKIGHNCFLNKICISSDGNVYPCIMERDKSYGNVKNQKLPEILKSAIAMKFRYLSKDLTETCRDCEYRYGCFDCRIKARMLDKENLYAKPWWCTYSPHTGEWITPEKGDSHENN